MNENVQDGAYVLTAKNFQNLKIIALAVVKNSKRSLVAVETNDKTNLTFEMPWRLLIILSKSFATETGPTDPENNAFVSIGEGVKE